MFPCLPIDPVVVVLNIKISHHPGIRAINEHDLKGVQCLAVRIRITANTGPVDAKGMMAVNAPCAVRHQIAFSRVNIGKERGYDHPTRGGEVKGNRSLHGRIKSHVAVVVDVELGVSTAKEIERGTYINQARREIVVLN